MFRSSNWDNCLHVVRPWIDVRTRARARVCVCARAQIPMVADLPVGENLHDHMFFDYHVTLNGPSSGISGDDLSSWWSRLKLMTLGTGESWHNYTSPAVNVKYIRCISTHGLWRYIRDLLVPPLTASIALILVIVKSWFIINEISCWRVNKMSKMSVEKGLGGMPS